MADSSAAVLAKPALNPAEQWWHDTAAAADRGASALLESESGDGRFQRSVYELFAEMEEKDGHLHAVLQTRLNGLLGLRRSIQPASASGDARAAAALATDAWNGFPRAEEFLRALLDGLAKGFAVVELLWGYDHAGRLVPVDWIAHPQEYFLFDARGRLLLLAPPFRESGASDGAALLPAGRGLLPAARAFAPPARKFIVLVFGRDTRNPYGRGLAQRCYWYYWFKKNNLRFWAIYNEKFGAPTAVASYAAGTSEEERRRLLDVLSALQTDAGVVVPESVSLRFLETASRGNATTYREMADWCNDEMSKAVLGATLTSGEGRRAGSLALGSIHDAVRHDYIEADARLLESVLGETLVRCLVELNRPGAPIPRLAIDATPPLDLEQQARVDAELVKLGVPIPLAYFYERYGRPVPRGNERLLRFDDSNLFQYHLQHGVLTINEVRERLQLPPVPWGGERTALPAPAPAFPAPPRGAAGASREELARGESPHESGAESEPRGR